MRCAEANGTAATKSHTTLDTISSNRRYMADPVDIVLFESEGMALYYMRHGATVQAVWFKT